MQNKNSFPIDTKKTAKTEYEYRERSKRLLLKYCHEFDVRAGDPSSFMNLPDREHFMSWLEAYRDRVTKSSWRKIRAETSFAVLYGMWALQYPWMAKVCVWETEVDGVYKDFYGNVVNVDAEHPCYGKQAEATPTLPFPSGIVSLPPEDAIIFAQRISDISTKNCPPPSKGSSKKKKNISNEEILAISDAMSTGRVTLFKKLTRNFFLANIIVGLRPVEWLDTKILVGGVAIDSLAMSNPLDCLSVDDMETLRGRGITLIIKNAKATNGRSHGETRELTIDPSIPNEYLSCIFSHWFSVQQIADGFAHASVFISDDRESRFFEFYTSCRFCLYKIVKRLWPRNKKIISLYSTRHQSIADAKTVLSKKEVAACYGHATDRTATVHYGKKRYGTSSRVFVTASEENVEKVKVVANDWIAPGKLIVRDIDKD